MTSEIFLQLLQLLAKTGNGTIVLIFWNNCWYIGKTKKSNGVRKAVLVKVNVKS